jgi:uncharacterized C2H2 Zn-finger protein
MFTVWPHYKVLELGATKRTAGSGSMPMMNCGQCGTQLRSIDDVIQHAETAHPHSNRNAQGELVCPGCPAAFRQIVQLQRHLAEAHGMQAAS